LRGPHWDGPQTGPGNNRLDRRVSKFDNEASAIGIGSGHAARLRRDAVLLTSMQKGIVSC